MNARKLTKTLLAVVIVAAGAYVFVYLGRWEWNRALIAGFFVLSAEIALSTLLLGEKLQRSRVPLRVDARAPLARLQESAPPARDHFAWLAPRGDRTSVFVPILMGAGVVLSALAWVVERIAHRTAGTYLERRLAQRLDALSFDVTAGLVPVRESSNEGTTEQLLMRPRVRKSP